MFDGNRLEREKKKKTPMKKIYSAVEDLAPAFMAAAVAAALG